VVNGYRFLLVTRPITSILEYIEDFKARDFRHNEPIGCKVDIIMTEQNRNYIKKEIGKLLSEIWRIKGLSEQEYGSNHSITKRLIIMHEQAQELLQEK
jgi:hypothetical protein